MHRQKFQQCFREITLAIMLRKFPLQKKNKMKTGPIQEKFIDTGLETATMCSTRSYG